MEDEKERPLISVVSPVFNEAGNVAKLVDALSKACLKSDYPYELILVDDGSTDQSWQLIQEVCAKNEHIFGLKLSRNFGHQHALLAGLSKAKGDAVISLDGDLQHPPELIPELIKQWRSGYEIVQTKRQYGPEDSYFKNASSKLFYRIFSALTAVKLPQGSSDFILIDRKVLNQILRFGDTDLFLRGVVQWVGFEKTTVSYNCAPRQWGSSKYSIKKMFRFASTALVSFSVIPLKIGIWLGCLTTLAAFIELIYIAVVYLRGETVAGWASVAGLTSLLFGILFINLGIMGTYLASIHTALQNRPRFIVAESCPKTEKLLASERSV